ncbi:MAG: ParB/RepB/Spo0J family partition protein [Candidatus Dadabacteria bacterium]|nr:ParB/RepB/Spo0J family partition protein [Candidatus Dadabacteria bacterium]
MDAVTKEIKLKEIKPSRNVIRGSSNVDLADLMQSMKTSGLIHPIVVRKNGQGYEIVAGHRRYEAAKKLKWPKVVCRVTHVNDEDQLVMNVTENLNRKNVSLEETYFAFKTLRDHDFTTREIAAAVGIAEKKVKEVFKLAGISRFRRIAKDVVFDNSQKQKGKLSYTKALQISDLAKVNGLNNKATDELVKVAKSGISSNKLKVAAAAVKTGMPPSKIEKVVDKMTEVRFSVLVDTKKRITWEKTTGKNFIEECFRCLNRGKFKNIILGKGG